MRFAHAWAASSVIASSVRPTRAASTNSAHVIGPPHGASPNTTPRTEAATSARTSSTPSSSGRVVCAGAPIRALGVGLRLGIGVSFHVVAPHLECRRAAGAVVDMARLAVVRMRGVGAAVAHAATAGRARPHR